MAVQENISPLVDASIVEEAIREQGIDDIGKATIREMVGVVNKIEEKTKISFIRMEMGVPGLPPSPIGVQAEIDALKKGVASKYPMLEGIKPFKEQASRFVKAFMNIDVKPEGCVPTVGSMQGAFAAFMGIEHMDQDKDTFLFIDPGFPVQKQQLQVLGYKYETFDVFHYRGKALREKLESYLWTHNICAIIYSNPNNPTWISYHEDELKIIGELAEEYDIVVIEDLAYFGMDFRTDLSVPFQAPYQPTVARYTNNYILLISSSKIFSYAGQRIATMCISNQLFDRYFESLKLRFGIGKFGPVIAGRILYSLSSGTSHSAQHAVAAIYKAACDGEYNFIERVKEYGLRAKLMKELFIKYGFSILYSTDVDEPIADGFYFTIAYPGLSGGELLRNLLYFGISAIALGNTGSELEGLRACVSQTEQKRFPELEKRLAKFAASL